MSRKTRRYFTDEFKQKIVNLHNAGRKRSELVREYELPPQPLANGSSRQEQLVPSILLIT